MCENTPIHGQEEESTATATATGIATGSVTDIDIDIDTDTGKGIATSAVMNTDRDCNHHFDDSSTHDTILLDVDHNDDDDDQMIISSSSSSSSSFLSSPTTTATETVTSIKEMELQIKTLYNQINDHDKCICNQEDDHNQDIDVSITDPPLSPRTTITLSSTLTSEHKTTIMASDLGRNYLSLSAPSSPTLTPLPSLATAPTSTPTPTPTQTRTSKNQHKLELQRRLNDKIYKLQSKMEQNRVETLKQKQQNQQQQEIEEPCISCPLCFQLFPKAEKYNERTREYFTCCGTPICTVCHSTYVRDCILNGENSEYGEYGDYGYGAAAATLTSLSSCISLSTLGATVTPALTVTVPSRRSSTSSHLQQPPSPPSSMSLSLSSPAVSVVPKRNISNHHEALLKKHSCPFCKEPWSMDEMTDSQRILKLAEQHQQEQQQGGGNIHHNTHGHIWAQVEIARRYEHGIGVEPNEELAMKWFHSAASAAAPPIPASTTSTGTTRSKNNASSSDTDEVRKAVASAHYHIGRFYKWAIMMPPDHGHNQEQEQQEQEQGKSSNVNNMSIAKHYFLLAAEQNHARAQHDLATMIVDEHYQSESKSLPVPPHDHQQTRKGSASTSINNKSARQNDHTDNDNDKDNNRRVSGKCDDDCKEAVYWYTLSLLQGYDEALYGIGNLYFMRGKMKSNKLDRAFEFGKALYWLRQSAEEKDMARGQMILGMALLENARNTYGYDLLQHTQSGYNVVPEVFFWLRKSSFNGELDAGTRLKNCQNVYLKQCAFCRRSGNLQWKKCHSCAGVSYCSVTCQKKDLESHANDCYEDE